VLLSWLPVTRSDESAGIRAPKLYLVEVKHAASGETRLRETTEQIFYPAELEPQQEWIARVSVAGSDSVSSATQIRFRTADPVVPVVARPDRGRAMPEGGVVLRWSEVADACAYELLVTEPGANSAAHVMTSATEARVRLAAKRHAATTYHAIVRAHFCDPGTGARRSWGPWSVEAGFGPAEFTVVPGASPRDPPR
jgi:hypothetical protein